MERIRVAVADDNEGFAAELGSRIRSDKALDLVGVAYNGEEICEIIRKQKPDVVTLDIIMPKKDGLAVLDTIMKDKSLEKVPSFIVVSAVGKDRIAQEAFESGADYFLRKPVEISTVLGKIRSIYSKYHEGFGQIKHETELKEDFIPYMSGEPVTDISSLLLELGIPAHIKGYQYLREAVMTALVHPEYISSVSKDLYPIVGEKYGTTAGKVERAIRHAIQVAWERGKMVSVDRLFGYSAGSRTGKPTNCEFIALLTDKLSLEYKNSLSKR